MKNIFLLLLIISASACTGQTNTEKNLTSLGVKLDTATLAGGCFWCMEASFEQIVGVHEVVSGYSGGKASDAYYKKVGTGMTGHAESIQIIFDPKIISFDQLLQVFFIAHDPTQLNRQGPDVGTQYRSEIFYHNSGQKQIATDLIKKLQPNFENKIVTAISVYSKFYPAEDYHQDFEKNNPNNPYILSVSKPKIEQVKVKFEDLIKDEYQK